MKKPNGAVFDTTGPDSKAGLDPDRPGDRRQRTQFLIIQQNQVGIVEGTAIIRHQCVDPATTVDAVFSRGSLR
ncbi:hypothetical protein ELH72_36465 [Rhizobium ruizarguesonis]|uniref:hypothetical protein n=1 Tax=Rhizobium ruizarguesonis TaxID=2081791 RepID=UPI0010305D17|nr:hypothetical protein [Rhizobium ruizarguesonis]TAZ67244.1 hypothetical protein ELH72_36465 [Rhizobium ruizarguesonis]